MEPKRPNLTLLGPFPKRPYQTRNEYQAELLEELAQSIEQMPPHEYEKLNIAAWLRSQKENLQ